MHNTMPELHQIAVIITVLASVIWISLQEKGVVPTSSNRTWHDATQNCVLYGSDVLNDTTVFPSNENVSSVYWIGATVTYTPVFQLLGCYVLKNNSEEVHDLSDKGSEGPMLQCYKICKKSNEDFIDFGINRTHCACSRHMNRIRENEKSCSLDQFSDTSNDIYAKELRSYSVFQKACQNYCSIEVKSTEECIAVELINDNMVSNHISIPCQEKLPYICKNTVYKEKVTWSQAAIKCNASLKTNTLGRYVQNVNGTVMAWTGFFRRHILKWTNESRNETACAAVMYKPGIGSYRTARPCTDLLPSLCQNGVQSTIVVSKNEPASEIQPKPVVDDPLKTIMFIGIGVGASVAIISVIIVIAVIYQLKIKTKKGKEVAERKSLNSTSNQTPRPSAVLNNAKEKSAYDSTMSSRGKCSNGDKESQHYGILHPKDDTCYDHTNTFQTLQMNDSEYSTVQSGDNVYDHTGDVHNPQTDDGDYSAMSTNADRGLYGDPSKMKNINPADSNYGITGLVWNQSL